MENIQALLSRAAPARAPSCFPFRELERRARKLFIIKGGDAKGREPKRKNPGRRNPGFSSTKEIYHDQ